MDQITDKNVVVLEAAPLLNFEVVMAKEVDLDFFIALNGPCKPMSCTSFWIDGNGSFVLRQKVGEFVTAPIPPELRPMIDAASEILFVEFDNGVAVNIKEVPRVVETIH